MNGDWPNQIHAVAEARRLIDRGVRRFCIVGPTGSGKSRIQRRIMEFGKPTVLLCHRVMLLEQLAKGIDEHGLPFGINASGYAPSILEGVQLGMIQTLESRWRRGIGDLPPADIVLLDEAHAERGERMCNVLNEYVNRGATVIGFTATPVGIGHMFDELVVAGTTSELIRYGSLIPAHTYAPDEPAMESFKPTTKGILQFKEEVKEVMLKVIFGRVIEHYHRLNPEQKPSILFAPGVDESRWFCEQFNEAGIPWSHIDSQRIYINGDAMAATRENRQLLAEASEAGRTKGISNRFVLREGIDFPWLAHGIFACTFGGIASYIQSGGRMLRAHHSLDHVVIQDHGGNYWRHDSLNCDREWSLNKSEAQMAGEQAEHYRTKAEAEPVSCPQCGKVRRGGIECTNPSCRFVAKAKQRVVIQTDGTLTNVHGDIYKPRRAAKDTPELHRKWTACVYRCRNSGRTFNQARALFQRENYGQVPGPEFPMVPKQEGDWYRKVVDLYPSKAKVSSE